MFSELGECDGLSQTLQAGSAPSRTAVSVCGANSEGLAGLALAHVSTEDGSFSPREEFMLVSSDSPSTHPPTHNRHLK
jgi:hypothetical protein